MHAMKEEDHCFQGFHNNIQEYHDPFLLQHQHQMLPWSLPSVQPFNPTRDHDPFIPQPPYGTFFNRSMDHPHAHGSHLRILSEALGPMIRPGLFGLEAEMGKMTAQEIMDAKALAASKSHSEAERRRRERINNHLAKLRSILPSTTKTDKASLLAEVIQHLKELKRQTSLIANTCPIPTETDELAVDLSDDGEGTLVIKASICCQDRSDLMHDVITALKSLRLRILKAEMTTLGGRVKNVFYIIGEEDSRTDDDDNGNNNGGEEEDQRSYCLSSVQEALRAVIEKNGGGEDQCSSGSVKRQRTNNINQCH